MNYLDVLYQLNKSKSVLKKSREQVVKLQNKRLRKILLYAYYHSQYYHEMFEKSGITKDNIKTTPITDFPTIDKKQLIENFDHVITVNDITQKELQEFDQNEIDRQRVLKNKYHIVHSSGSTGEPRYFLYDNQSWNTMLIGIIRAALWGMSMSEILKFLKDKPRILYIAATDGRYGGFMAVGNGVQDLGVEQISLDINQPLEEWIDKVKNFKPNIIIGYPSAIKILTELVESKELELDVLRVTTCGEPLDINLRNYIEETLAAKVFNFYGASETIAIGIEDDPFDGIYLFDDLNYVEFIDGNMYITSLYNYVQPLIRYKLNDTISFKKENEKYPLSRIDSIVGRNEDLMWFENENGKRDFLHPLAIEGFCIDGLLDYQFKQVDKKSFEMYAQVANEHQKKNIEKEMLSQMGKILKDKNLEYVKFVVNFIKEILPDEQTGKKKLVIT